MAALCRRWQRATAVLPHFRPQPVCHIATGDIAGRLHLYEELQAASILDARKARAMARSVGAVQPEQRSALVQRARQREKDRKRAAKAKAAKALEQAKRAAANPGMAVRGEQTWVGETNRCTPPPLRAPTGFLGL